MHGQDSEPVGECSLRRPIKRAQTLSWIQHTITLLEPPKTLGKLQTEKINDDLLRECAMVSVNKWTGGHLGRLRDFLEIEQEMVSHFHLALRPMSRSDKKRSPIPISFPSTSTSVRLPEISLVGPAKNLLLEAFRPSSHRGLGRWATSHHIKDNPVGTFGTPPSPCSYEVCQSILLETWQPEADVFSHASIRAQGTAEVATYS